jgi:hypothetical protein
MTTINTSNALGAKVKFHWPLNGTEGEIKTGTALVMGTGGSFATDPTYGPYLKGDLVNPVAHQDNIDLTAQTGFTIAFRAYCTGPTDNSDGFLWELGEPWDTVPGGCGFALQAGGGDMTVVINSNQSGGTYKAFTRVNLGWHYFIIDIRNGNGGSWTTVQVDGQTPTVTFDPQGFSTGNRGNNTMYFLGRNTTKLAANRLQKVTIFNSVLSQAEKDSLLANPDQIVNAAADTIPPTIASAQTNATGDVIQITFSETLAHVTPDSSAFTVSGGHAIGGIDIGTDGPNKGAIYGLSPVIAPGETVTFSYVQPATNQIQDAAANMMVSVANVAVTNTVPIPGDTTPPAIQSAVLMVDPANSTKQIIRLTFTEAMDAAKYPEAIGATAASAWSVSGNAAVSVTATTRTSLGANPGVLDINLNGTFVSTDNVRLTYTPNANATGKYSDLSGNPLAAVSNFVVTNSISGALTYTADTTTNFPNPERGFYMELLHGGNFTAANFNTYKAQGVSLVKYMVYLGSYVTTALDSTFLTAFQNNLNAIRTNGLKVVLRFAFSSTAATDATESRIMSHMDQLAPYFTSNADIIIGLQAGWIGQWGEFQGSNNFGADAWPTSLSQANKDARKRVIDKCLAVMPDNKPVMLRQPWYKLQMYSSTPVGASNAYDGSALSRLGHFNDSFLTSSNDGGTYYQQTTEQTYMDTDTQWVPVGGETNGGSAPRNAGPSALAEMARFHWSYLNIGYDTTVLNTWKDGQDSYGQAQRKLGYRLRLVSAQLPNVFTPGGTVGVKFVINNDGFAAPFLPRKIKLILRSGTTVRSIDMTSDWRKFLPGQTVIQETLTLPADLAPGTYNVALHLPDNYASLANNPTFAVRFANTNMWEATTGYNLLGTSVTVPNAQANGHRFYMLRVLATNGSFNNQVAFGEIELRATPGGADLTTPTTKVTVSSASPQYNEIAANILDNNNQSTYSSDSSKPAPHTIIFDLGSPKVVQQLAILPQQYTDTNMVLGRTMRDFDWLSAEDDGTGNPAGFALQRSYRGKPASDWNLTQLNLLDVTPQAATKISMTGPASGPLGDSSYVFTMTIDGTVPNDVVVTPPTISGLTFDPPSIIISKSTGQGQFTIHGDSLGSYTLTGFTNNAGLTNPASQSFSVVTSVVKHIGAGQEFADLNAFAGWLWNQTPVDGRYMIFGKLHDASFSGAGVSLTLQQSSSQYYCEIGPADGMSIASPLRWGSNPVTITLGTADYLNLNLGVRFVNVQFDITGAGIATSSGLGWAYNNTMKVPELAHCVIRANTANNPLRLGIYAVATAMDNCLFIQTGSNDRSIGQIDGWLDMRNCGFVRYGTYGQPLFLNTGALALTNSWGWNVMAAGRLSSDTGNWREFKGNVFNQDVVTGSVMDNSQPPTIGCITANNFLVDPSSATGDFTPASGGALVGHATRIANATLDFFGNNHGLTPDVGPVQRTPAPTLAVAQVTTQTLDGASLTVAGSVTGTVDSATITIVPTDTRYINHSIGPLAVPVVAGAFTITIDNIVPGSYAAPSLLFTNGGGTSAAKGTAPFELMGVSGTAMDSGTITPATSVVYSTTAPTTGTAGSSTAAFSVSLDGAKSGIVTLALSDNGKGGVFSPQAPTIVNGAPASFTYTPSVAGSITISITNDAGLTNPAPVVMTIAPAVLPAPTVAVTTGDTAIMRGARATLSGTTNLQGDATGTVSLYIESQLDSTVQGPLGTVNVSGGTWTVQYQPIPVGIWKFRVDATANGQTAQARTGIIRVLGLTGSPALPTP